MQAIGKLTSLEWLRITGPSVTDEYVAALNDLPHLKIVDISNSIITDKSLEILKTRTEIHTLELQRNLQLSDNALKLFAEFPNLQTLKILYNGFSSASLYNLDALKTVQVLDLRGLPVGDDTLMFLADLENLEEVRFRSISITNAGIAELAKCEKLKTVELQDTSVGAGSADSFKEMKSLRSLRIFRGSEFGADAVAELGVLTDLDTLELRGVGCSNEALLALKPLTQLKTVEFSELPGVDSATVIDVLKSYPKLESIHIFAIPVNDSVASFLATVSTLKSVSLPATAITDAGLDALSVLSDLTLLDIHGNKERLTLPGATSALSKFKNLRRLIMPETLSDPALKSEILKNSPRCNFTVKTYSQET
jgi:Leucine-rich repeat (LRR) protein